MESDVNGGRSTKGPEVSVSSSLVPGLRDSAALSELVLRRTQKIERSIRRRRMILLLFSLAAVFAVAIGLLMSGLAEQADRRLASQKIGMHGLALAGKDVAAPLVMWRETWRQDLRVARELSQIDGPQPVLARSVEAFLAARGAAARSHASDGP